MLAGLACLLLVLLCADEPPPPPPLVQSSLPVATVATCGASGTYAAGSGCQTDTAVSCSAGTYGVSVASGKICALCAAGSYSSDGNGCTACPSGSAAGVVGASAQASCAVCPAGTYAAGGNSDCIPCDAGTYQDSTTGAGSCTTW